MTHILGFSLFENEITPSISEEILSQIELPIERLKVIASTVLQDQKRIEALLGINE
jgi:hypothetical protein